MQGKFTVKVQKIGGVKPGDSHSFSVPLVVEPEDEVSIRRGLLYSTVEVISSTSFDPNLVVKVITDTLQNEYFNNPEGTPLQCLEKCVTSIRDRVFTLLSDPKVINVGVIEFNTVISVLWGSVLYVVQYGDGCSYLVREGKIKPINTSSEGNFSVASGVVKDGDIVILGSKGFCEKYSPETLIGASPSVVSGSDAAAVFLKFYAVKTDAASPLDIRDPLYEKIKVRRGNGTEAKRKILAVFAVVLAVLLFISVAYAFRRNRAQVKSESIASVVESGRNALEEADKLLGTDDEKARNILKEGKKALEEAQKKFSSKEIDGLISEANVKLEQVDKIRKIEDRVFYDLKIDDKEGNPSEISVSGSGSAFVVDKDKSKFYRLSFLSSPQVSVVESTQAATPKYLSSVESGVAFVGADAFYAYDSGSNKISKTGGSLPASFGEIKAFGSYLGNLYVVHGGKILKNGTSWVEDQALSDTVSMAIDGSIYVLTKGGSVLKYTSGEKENFNVRGLEGGFKEPVTVYTTADLSNLYVLDRGGKRVAVFGKDGSLKAQYVLSGDSQAWDDLKSLSVSVDEKTILVLSSSKIYKIEL